MSAHRPTRRNILKSAGGLSAVMALGVSGVPTARAAGIEDTRPDFRLPFPCGVKVELKTYRGHNPDDKKIDMYRYGMPSGSPILASADGFVHENFWSSGGLEIRHGNGWFSLYLHMTGVAQAGTWVKRGDIIGYMGDVGSPGKPHLHYEQLYNPNSDQDADTQHMVHPKLQGQLLIMNPDHPVDMISTNSCGGPVPGGGDLFALSPDRSGVFQYSGQGVAWTKVGGAAGELVAGGAGLFATNPSTGDLFRFSGTPDEWSKVGGPAAQFVVAGDGLYGLSPDRSAVFQWSGSGTLWTKVGGAAGRLCGGGAGLFSTNPSTGDLFRFSGTPDEWSKVGGPAAQFAVTGNHLYGLSPDKSAVLQWSGSGTSWIKVGGAAGELVAGGAGLFSTNPSTGDLFRFSGTPDEWSKVGGPAAQFAVTGDHLYGLSPDRSAVFQWSGSGIEWNKVGGPAHSLAGR
ncbi:M23 family metallopeptidase [Streptomyces sp. C11-1]|uniref:M23 family metallopeptidase n=1 Tax=Streptomyces durocortorensis TaxID=2811104 RepID=A0ABY9VXY2_9ACTN|nr:M23 family metallopeptidase [Streptomyces durocortorensis]WNF28395.1 M23 family metallopeptidase [Streptomyces durocortorensis]